MTEDNVILKIDKCPNCGSHRRLHEEEMEPIIKGRVGLTVQAAILQVILFDPQGILPLSAPVLMSRMDICAECGTYYCVEAKKVTVPLTVQPPQGGQGSARGQSPFSGPDFPMNQG